GPLVLHLGLPTDRTGAVPPRVGFVISAKVGDAVRRNRLRRRLRHLLRGRLAALPPADLVVRALPGAAELSYTELDRLLDDGLRSLVDR
ncbi:MAG TPA: ribonuclease P protein component, partial [Mycobacteriales bacterium]|nr:ribonuclease P protein component [Mycobacteriales bacterium]